MAQINLTSKWLNCNQELYSIHLKNLSHLIAISSPPAQLKEYQSLINNYLKHQTSFQSLLASLTDCFQSEEKREAKQYKDKFDDKDQERQKHWSQLLQQMKKKEIAQIDEIFMTKILKHQIEQYLTSARQYLQISNIPEQEFSNDFLKNLQSINLLRLSETASFSSEMENITKKLGLPQLEAKQASTRKKNQTLKEYIEKGVESEAEHSDTVRLYEERKKKTLQIERKQKKLEETKEEIKEVKKKINNMKNSIHLMESSSGAVKAELVQVEKGRQQFEGNQNGFQVSREQRRKVIFVPKSIKERSIHLTIWAVILLVLFAFV